MLNCYNPPNGGEHPATCKELNCYNDFLDTKLRAHVMWLKSKLLQCEPEHDIPDAIKHSSPLETKFSLGHEAPISEVPAPEHGATTAASLPEDALWLLAVLQSQHRARENSRSVASCRAEQRRRQLAVSGSFL